MNIENLQLDIKDLDSDPIKQFATWFNEAQKQTSMNYPNAMCLSTIDKEGFPDSRIVLLKEFSNSGFSFFTNTNSTKGQSLLKYKHCALNFYWDDLHRQIRIQGEVSLVNDDNADEYFKSRPRDSQIGAHASLQSEELENRLALEERFQNIKNKYNETDVPRPKNWSGFIVKPFRIEFWQERASRLHDRFIYDLNKNTKEWKITRRYP